MKNIYEVFNDVNIINVDETENVTEDVQVIMSRLDTNNKRRNPLIKVAACVAGVCILSGGMVYAYANNVFSKIIEKQNKGIIEEKYIDDDFLDNKYTGDYQVLGMNEEDGITVDVIKYEVNYDKVYLAVLVTNDAFDVDKYSRYSADILPMDGGDIAVYDSMSYEYTNGKYRVKELNENQILLCWEFDFDNMDTFIKNGQIEFKLTNLCYYEKKDASESEEIKCKEAQNQDLCTIVMPVTADATMKMKEAVMQGEADIESIEMTSMCVYIYGNSEYKNKDGIKIVMTDGTVSTDIEDCTSIVSNSERTKYTYCMLAPLDLEQVEALEIDGVRYEMQYRD